MKLLVTLFGEGQNLNWTQMTCRGIAIFFITLVLVRISGRRSFGLHTPLDNVIIILLGSILGRAVVGASPILPVMMTATAVVLLHRLISYLTARNETLCNIVEGKKFLLYKNDEFIAANLKKALVSEEDVMQEVRKSALTEDLDKIDAVYMERSGYISSIRKEQPKA